MRKDRIAEWILQLVCTPARAESTVGDLMESGATRGDVWFWANVWRTTSSLLWRGMTSDPRKMLGLAVRGFLLNLSLLAVFFLGFIVLLLVHGFVVGITAHPGGQVPNDFGPIANWILSDISMIVAGCCHFEVGCWVARRASGRELAACLATILLPMAVGTFLLLAFALDTNEHQGSATFDVMTNQFPCLLGAIWVRKRTTS